MDVAKKSKNRKSFQFRDSKEKRDIVDTQTHAPAAHRCYITWPGFFPTLWRARDHSPPQMDDA